MEDKILEVLSECEAEHPIQILSARERGSRMMGVPHDDSDWDVMFVYCFDKTWKYVAQGHSLETVTHEDGDIDLHGWNLDKFAKHYVDSNPTAAEFLSQEPYRQEHRFAWRDVEEEMEENFNHMALYHHYISMAASNYKKYVASGNDCTRGRQFYVMRAVAYARYIRIEGEMPEMNVYDFLDESDDALSDEEHDKLLWLADQKSDGKGSEEHPDVVGDFYKAESDAPMEPSAERISSPAEGAVNGLIKKALNRR